MSYRLFTPTPELADVVISYWYARIKRNCYAEQQYATPLFEGLIFNFTRLKEYVQRDGKTILLTKTAYLFGQAKSYTTMWGCPENDGYIIGVRFRPLGLVRLTGLNMMHLANTAIDAEAVWGSQLESLGQAMQEAINIAGAIGVLEDFLKKQRRKTAPPSRLRNVAQAIALMEGRQGNISCKRLQDLTNTGKKTLQRAFMDFHGMNPKMYLRIVRYNAARNRLEQGLRTSLTDLAYQLGYFDQAHFTRDFKRFSRQTPSEYLQLVADQRKRRDIPVD